MRALPSGDRKLAARCIPRSANSGFRRKPAHPHCRKDKRAVIA